MTQPSLLDYRPTQAGKALRDAGMAQAVTHAEDKTPGWSEMALVMLRRFLQDKGDTSFMAEEFRLYAIANGLPRPPHARAFGGIMSTARRRRLIECVGISQVTNERAHCANAAVWRAA